jgi:hypothetical protein
MGFQNNKSIEVLPQYAPLPSNIKSYSNYLDYICHLILLVPIYNNQSIGLQTVYSGLDPSNLIVAVYLYDPVSSTYSISFSRINSQMGVVANWLIWTY